MSAGRVEAASVESGEAASAEGVEASAARARERRFGGWAFVACAAAFVCVMVAGLLATRGAGEEGLRAVIRNTARTSVALFLAGFVAHALAALWPSRVTRWLGENDAHLFAAFAASHLLHAAAIFALAWATAGASLADRPAGVVAAGGIVYLFILLAAAPALAPAAAWIERRAWARLVRTTGLYVVWLTFLDSYGGRVLAGERFYLPFAALLVAALLPRLAAPFAPAKR